MSMYKAQMDCFVKTKTFQGLDGREIIFKGERNDILNYIILAMTARKMMKKGVKLTLPMFWRQKRKIFNCQMFQ